MAFVLICVGVATVAFLLLRGPAKQFRMGQHLTRMTNIFEEIEHTRYTMHIGAGGGVDSLPPARQRQAEAEFEQGISYLKNYPRHEVTRELMKNALLAERMDRPVRVIAIHRLIEALTRLDVALEVGEFAKSYA
jgi:hypothetical protein